jgi:hypothetical protein
VKYFAYFECWVVFELKDAINSINRRKSADYYNITIDHFLYSEDQIISILLLLINNIFRAGEIPDSLKIGLLFASSTGRAAFLGDAPFVKPLCEVFCIF